MERQSTLPAAGRAPGPTTLNHSEPNAPPVHGEPVQGEPAVPSAATSAGVTLEGIERLKSLARLVLAASLGLSFLLAPPRGTPLYWVALITFALYFVYAVAVLVFRRQLLGRAARAATLAGDAAALVVVLLLGPNLPAAFLLFFVYFALVAGWWQGWLAAALLSLGVSAAYLGLSWRQAAEPGASWWSALPRESWLVVAGLLAAGGLVGTVAERQRRQLERAAVIERFAALLSLDAGWPEPARRWLAALAARYDAARALLAYRDPDSDRVLLWVFRGGEAGGAFEEQDRPPRDVHEFLLDNEPRAFLAADLPARLVEEFSPQDTMSAPLPGGRGQGRLFLFDRARVVFSPAQLDDLERLLAGLEPGLTNLLLIRSQASRAVEAERDRIVRHLHDGVAQTLASVEMQLNVYRRLAVADPAKTAEELAGLQAVVKQEQEELRRFLRTLKSVHVPATELGRWMFAHSAQFEQETGIEVDFWADPVDAALPEGICREVFWILREALHNVQKHARAQHVMVRLRQDEAFLRLLVDDDGCGFSFTGTYSQRALEEQGLGPVSIGERTRALGGALTIDSSPGSGSTLRVDIPLT